MRADPKTRFLPAISANKVVATGARHRPRFIRLFVAWSTYSWNQAARSCFAVFGRRTLAVRTEPRKRGSSRKARSLPLTFRFGSASWKSAGALLTDLGYGSMGLGAGFGARSQNGPTGRFWWILSWRRFWREVSTWDIDVRKHVDGLPLIFCNFSCHHSFRKRLCTLLRCSVFVLVRS
jgi:hypothetical protein